MVEFVIGTAFGALLVFGLVALAAVVPSRVGMPDPVPAERPRPQRGQVYYIKAIGIVPVDGVTETLVSFMVADVSVVWSLEDWESAGPRLLFNTPEEASSALWHIESGRMG